MSTTTKTKELHLNEVFDDNGNLTHYTDQQGRVIPNYDNTLYGYLIANAENPDSIGYDDGKWFDPTLYRPKCDKNQRGLGVDIRPSVNEYTEPFLKIEQDGKNKGQSYLTEQDEHKIRQQKIYEAEKSYGRRLAFARRFNNSEATPSETKKAMVMERHIRWRTITPVCGFSTQYSISHSDVMCFNCAGRYDRHVVL